MPKKPQRKRKRKPKTLSPAKVARTTESGYEKMLRQMVTKSHRLTFRKLLAMIKYRKEIKLALDSDNVTDDVRQQFEETEEDIKAIRNTALALALGWLARIDDQNKKKLATAYESAFGIDILNTPAAPAIEGVVQAATAKNLDLITTLSADTVSKIKANVYQLIADGEFTEKNLRESMTDRLGIDRRRATFIARDQTHKYNAALTEARAEELGLREYIWHNQGDRRVRGRPDGMYPKAKHNHWNREGKKYSYGKPPSDGNPGEPYNCRCWAELVIPGS